MMRKNLCVWFVLLSLILSGCGIRGTSGRKTDKNITYIILYFAQPDGRYLEPEARDVFDRNESLLKIIIGELIKGPSNMLKRTLPENLKLKSVKVKGSGAYVDFESDFTRGVDENLAVNSVVNSLTELPGIDSVQFLIKGKKFKSPFKRCRSAFKREEMNPSQVLERQMSFEKKGDYMNGYVLMSDEKSEGRKYYDDYVKELDEARDDGLLEADFAVGGYVVDESGLCAKVKVNFITGIPGEGKVKGQDVFFRTVLIDGFWMVDWFAGMGQDT